MMWRALTLKQPWAFAVTYAGKDVENRTWPVPTKLNCDRCRGKGAVVTSELIYGECERCGGLGHFNIEDQGHRVMIHAGSQWDETAVRLWPESVDGSMSYYHAGMLADHALVGGKLHGIHAQEIFQPFSAVVGVATITGSHSEWDCLTDTPGFSSCSEWAISAPAEDEAMHHWELADVRPLSNPILAKGRPGLWKTVDLVQSVESQLTIGPGGDGGPM